MKKLINTSFYLLLLLKLSLASGQIGIGTITPRGALEVNSATNGFVAPQVALTATNASAPVINPQTAGVPIAGTVVYNTATAGAGVTTVTPGHYYWDGSGWLRVATGSNSDWTTAGNTSTIAGTNFIGTTDAIDIRIKTNGTDRWNISHANSGQLQSYSLGTAALPVYSFQPDPNTGFFSPAADFLAATTAGTERIRIESDGDFGIGTTLPLNRLHIVNNADNQGVMRIDNGTAGGFSGLYLFQGANYRGHFGYVNTGGTSGFGGKGAYQLAAGSRPIVFSTDDLATELFKERMVIAQDGRVGINTNPTSTDPTVQPNSHLQVAGSFAVGIWSIGVTYTLDEDECKIILSNGGTNITITPPDPTTCRGRLMSFSRNASSTGTVTINPVGSNNIQNLDGTVTNTTTIPLHSAAGAGVNIQFWSDGAIWYR